MKNSSEGAGSFDPTRTFYAAQDRRPSNLANVNLGQLSSLLRMLLVEDGTVTNAIAAFHLQAVTTTQIDQRTSTLPQDHPWLELPAGATVLERRVMLCGGVDRALFVFAESLLALDRLSDRMRSALEDEDSNLGRILRGERSETLREGLWYGREHLSEMPAAVADKCSGDFLSRSYRVISKRRPVMLITERFPLESFE